MRYIKFPLLILLIFVLCRCHNEDVEKKVVITKDSASPVKNEPVTQALPLKDSLVPVIINQSELPAGISFKGNNFHYGYKWYDKTGHNILVLSTSSLSVEDKQFGEFENSGELFATLYNLKDPLKPRIVWNMYDAQLKCIFDLTCSFITSEVTDLDADSLKEVSILYKLSCRSDAQPARMKLIMHEGKQKYALRGLMILRATAFPDSLFPENREIDLSKISNDEITNTLFRHWGCYENANEFNNAPHEFLFYARQLWRDNSSE
jgi:hypothetical protein